MSVNEIRVKIRPQGHHRLEKAGDVTKNWSLSLKSNHKV